MNIIFACGLAKSKSEARRLVEQGAVKINGVKILDIKCAVSVGEIIKVGKDKFVKVIA